MLTIAMPFYENQGMLAKHYANWLSWPRNCGLKIIIVDDGSPKERASDVPRPQCLDIQIYRVLEDRPWHQHAARNLAMKMANGWTLLTDMDHMLVDPAPLLEAMPNLDPHKSYTLDRIEADTGKPTLGKDGRPKPHPNTFLLTSDLYWKIGGYDEAYCGIYGTDKLFRNRREKHPCGHLNVPLTRYWRDIEPDASTRTLPRKEGREAGAKAKVLADKIRRGEMNRVVTLDFPWERVI